MTENFNQVNRVAQPIRAYHGTPHSFELFCLTSVGTGEGNQTFGFGLYFAENIEVARHYQTLLATKLAGKESGAAASLSAGNLYTVEIHHGKDEFMDWDKPLAAQSRFVRERLRQSGVARDYRANRADFSSPGWTRGSEARGHNLYGFLSWRRSALGLDGDREASRLLGEAGIAGIRYLDQGSRGRPGRGTINLVLFDTAAVLITHRNGVLVAAQEATPTVREVPIVESPVDVAGYLLCKEKTTNQKHHHQTLT